MALSAAQRRRIPAKDFVFPEERKYPIDTRKRAQEALSLAALHGAQLGGAKGRALIDKVYGAVTRRYRSLIESDSKTMRAYLRRKGNKPMARSNPVTMSDAKIIKHINKHLEKYMKWLDTINPDSFDKTSFRKDFDKLVQLAGGLQYNAQLYLREMAEIDEDYPKRGRTRKNATYGTYRRGTLGYDKDGPDRISRREAGGLEEYRLVVRKLKSLGLSTEGKLPTLKRRLAAAMKRRNPGRNRRMNKAQFDAMFREDIMPSVWQQEAKFQGGSWDHADASLRRTIYNDMIDDYVRNQIVSSSAYNWFHPRWLETLRPPRDNPGHARKKTSMVSRREAGGLEEYRLVVRHLKSLGLSTKGKLPTLQRRLDAAMARGEYPIIDEREFMSRGKKVKAVSRLVSRRNPGRKRKMAPAVKSRAALVKKAFALREKTGSPMKPTTIMKDPAAAIRRLSR